MTPTEMRLLADRIANLPTWKYRDGTDACSLPVVSPMMRDLIVAALRAPEAADAGAVARPFPVEAFSADLTDDRVLRLHYRQPVTNADREQLLAAMNAARKTSPTAAGIAAPPDIALLKECRQFVADAGCDEDDSEVNQRRDELLVRIDALCAAPPAASADAVREANEAVHNGGGEKPFMMQSCVEAKQCLHQVPGCICDQDPAQPAASGDAVRFLAQPKRT